MKLFWEQNFNVQTRDADFNNRLRVSSIFNFMQDAASAHAHHLNVGFNQLLEQNIFWALTQAKVEILDYPEFENEITVQTWPKGKYRLYALRDFFLKNGDQIFCRASTSWLLVNRSTRKIIDGSSIIGSFPYKTDLSAIDFTPIKMPVCNNLEHVFNRSIRYSDIDINKHLNNAKYIEMIYDCFDKEFLDLRLTKEIIVNYASEIVYGESIDLFKGSIDDKTIVTGQTSDGRNVFQSLITFK